MRIVEIKYYTFEELSEEAQQNALSELWNLNVDHEWWEFTYEDAENIGLNIQSFDIDRHEIDANLIWYANDVAHAITKEHGKNTDTYKLAKQFQKDLEDLEMEADLGEYDKEQKQDELSEDFCRNLSVEYLSMLRNEYEYLTSEECIKESILANNYEFTEDGELI